MFRIKRVYAPAETGDGFRVLVDRLWPRGLTKEAAGIDLWLKEVGPSSELRRWFGHAPGRWEEFTHRYRAELAAPGWRAALDRLLALERESGSVTLLYAARDETHNHAALLRQVLGERARAGH